MMSRTSCKIALSNTFCRTTAVFEYRRNDRFCMQNARCECNAANRNLRPRDVVIVADRNTMRGEYRLGLAQEVFDTGEDIRT